MRRRNEASELTDGTVHAALVGQPNAGKSSLFTRLTGVGVIASNYPGTTVEFKEGAVVRKGTTVIVHDLPGTYALSGDSEDEKVVVDDLLSGRDESIVVVVDSTDLSGGIALCLEVIELRVPAILALTKIDESRKRSTIDADKLSSILGIPVMAVSSKTSEGVDALADAICEGKAKVSSLSVDYGEDIEKAISALVDGMGEQKLEPRCIAVKALSGVPEFTGLLDEGMARTVGIMKGLFSDRNGSDIAVGIATARFGMADHIVSEVVGKNDHAPTLSERISDLTLTPITGIPILAGVCLLLLGVIVIGGSWIDGLVSSAYDAIIGNAIIDIGKSIGGDFWTSVFTGIDGSFRAILGVVIPYIMVFYLALGILEDSGYLPRAVVLLDRTMHHFGLHGGSFIPMMVGLGCNVPAIMAVRTIRSRREKIILSSMIVMAVPCSAQMAIIMGATGHYSGILYAFGILVMLALLGMLMGVLLNRFLKYEPSNLAMEIPDLQLPSAKNVLFKTWTRTKDFFTVAFPLLIVGSIIIELLLTFNLLNAVVDPLSPITTGLLGLPAVCAISFIVGVLRKEMALGMLQILAGGVALSEFLTPEQFVVFGVVMAVYMPCLATLVTMWKEIGWKETIAVSAVSICAAIALGSIVNVLLTGF